MAQEHKELANWREDALKPLDRIASQLVTGDPGTLDAAPLLAGLSEAMEAARRVGAEDFLRMANEYVERWRQAGCQADEVSEAVEKLREALNRAQEASTQADAAVSARRVHKPNHEAAAMLAQDPELVADFVTESREHLEAIELHLLSVEQNPEDADALNALFRSFHSVKGLAGFLGFEHIEEVAHDAENLLDRARNRQLTITPAVADVILAARDFLTTSIEQVENAANGSPSGQPLDSAPLLARIADILEGRQTASKAEPTPSGGSSAVEAAQALPAALSEPGLSHAADDSARSSGEGGIQQVHSRFVRGAATVKVDTEKLDYLVDMVGELVIAQTQVQHDSDLTASQGGRLQRSISQLSRVTAEVQRTAMALRMVPIGTLFQRMARLVRDLARKFSKEVRMETFGEDTELDRRIVEELADPLMHMVRNAIDHGMESPEEREAAGKSRCGRLLLRASHQAGHILIEVGDDGRGLNKEKILAKAIERGLVQSGEGLSDSDIYNLIFEPGFSTASQVTELSGRGVGMDVVRRQIQRLRGRVEIKSTPGQGTTFLMRLPLTMAIIDGLVVSVGEERYIVPIYAVREMFRPEPGMVSTVEGKHEVVHVRGNLYPVVRLHERFNVQPRSTDPCQGLMILAETQLTLFCLLVDESFGKQEVVIKSLGESLKGLPGIAGGAILGDGRVGLILDLDGVYRGN